MIVGDIVRKQARSYPNKDAIIFEGERISWKTLNDRVNSLANAFSGLGIKKGDRIAILEYNCNQYPETLFACAKTGIILATVNYRFVPKEIYFVLNNSGATTLIIGKEFLKSLDEIRSEARNLKNVIVIGEKLKDAYNFEELLAQYPTDEPATNVDEEDPLMLIYTSGTTGFPKGVQISHKNIISFCTNYSIAFSIVPDDITLIVSPLFHIGAESMAIAHWYVGCTNILHRTFDVKQWCETVEREKVTTALLLPTMINMVLNFPDVRKYRYDSVRMITHSGEVMPVARTKKGFEVFDCKITELYGSTECASSTFMVKDKSVLDKSDRELMRLSSCGKDFFNAETTIFDEEGREVQPGEVGEIAIKGDCVTKGYWNLPEENKQRFRGGWLYMRDLGRFDEDGFMYLTDRKDDMIKSGGENIYPREIEEVLNLHPAIANAAVIGVPDDKWTQAVKALVILKEGAKVTEEEIIGFCRGKIAGYKVPKSVDFMETFPSTPTGKVLKKELKKIYWKK